MDDREKFRKNIEYTPIRSSGVIVNEKEVMERKRRAREAKIRQQKRQRKIKGIATIGTIAFAGAIMAAVIPKEQQKQNQKILEQEARIRQEFASEKYQNSLEQNMEYEISQIAEEVNKIELTKEAILEDVKKQYIDQYNKEHNEDIKECQLLSSPQDYLFITQEGQYITHGDYPREVGTFLDNNGISYTTTDKNSKVYYSYADGKTLEMMTRGKEYEWVDVTSGQEIEKINDKEYKNTLIEMKPVIDKGIEWANAPENKQLKEEYIAALENFEEKETQKSANNQDKEEKSQEEEYEL